MEEDNIASALAMTKISVAIRVRPLIQREKLKGGQVHWVVEPQELKQLGVESKKSKFGDPGLSYVYDHVFDQSTQTKEIYDCVVSPIVQKSFMGFNGTILCYGQTSSGKTHTLYGSDTDKGIILLFADQVFDQIKAGDGKRQYIIKVGLLEIYNEKVTDLLNSENPIDLQEKDGTVVPHGLEGITVLNVDDMKKVAERIQRERKIGETRMNKESSRSHTILRVTIESFDVLPEDGDSEESPRLTTAVLHFVDLAGSEKQSQTGAEGERFKEQVNINKSLSELSHVIKQLSDNASRLDQFENPNLKPTSYSMGRLAPKSRFVNFRNSKLTRLLQSTLNGEAYTSMICNVTIASLDDTKSTLLFAKQAKDIKVSPKQNLCAKSEYEDKFRELQEMLSSKDKEVLTLRRQLDNLTRIGAISFSTESSKKISTLPPLPDRRFSLCPSLLSRNSEGSKSHDEPSAYTGLNRYASVTLNTSGYEVFRNAEDHFRNLQTIRECSVGEDKQVDKEVQTDSNLSPAKPAIMSDRQGGTPIQTLRLTNALLLQTYENSSNEWERDRSFLECEAKINRAELASVKEQQKALLMQSQEQQLMDKLNEQQACYEELQLNNVKLVSRVKVLNEALETERQEKLHLMEKLSIEEKQLRTDNTSLEKAEESLVEQLSQEMKDNHIFQSKLDEAANSISQLRTEKELLQNELLELANFKVHQKELQMQSQEQQLMDKLNEQQACCEELQLNNVKLESRVKVLDEALETERQQKLHLMEKLSIEEKQLRTENTSLKNAKESLEEQLSQEVKDKHIFQAKLDEATNSISQLRTEKELLQNELPELANIKEQLKALLIQMQSQEQQLRDKLKEQQACCEELQLNNVKLESRVKVLDDTLETERQEKLHLMEKLSGEEQQLRTDYASLKKAKESLEEQLSQEVKDNHIFKSKLDEASNSISQLRTEKELLQNELPELANIKEQQKALIMQMHSQEQQLMDKLNEQQACYEELQLNNVKLESRVKVLDEALETERQQKVHLMEKLSIEEKQLRTENTSLKKAKESLEEQLSQEVKDNHIFKSKLDEASNSISQLRTEKELLQNELPELANIKEQQKALIMQMHSQEQQLMDKLNEQQACCEELQLNNVKLESRVKVLDEALETGRQQNLHLMEKLSIEEKQLRTENTSLKNAKESLEEQLSQEMKDNHIFKSKLDEAANSISQLRTEKELLQNELPESAALVEDLRTQLQEVNNALLLSQRRKPIMVNRGTEACDSYQNLLDRLKYLELNCDRAVFEYRKQKKKNTEDKAKYISKVKDLEDMIANKENVVEKLETKFHKLMEENSASVTETATAVSHPPGDQGHILVASSSAQAGQEGATAATRSHVKLLDGISIEGMSATELENIQWLENLLNRPTHN